MSACNTVTCGHPYGLDLILVATARAAQAVYREVDAKNVPPAVRTALTELLQAASTKGDLRPLVINVLAAWYRHGQVHGSDAMHSDLCLPMQGLQRALNAGNAEVRCAERTLNQAGVAA